MLHLTILLSPLNADLKSECNEIASVLKGPDVDVRVYEAPVTYRADSDFWLIFANDLSSHDQALRDKPDMRIDPARFVLLRPPHDRAIEIAEAHRVAAVVDYDGPSAWRVDSRRGLIVRTDIASELSGELGRAVQSEHYASWWPGPDQPLSSQLVTYLRAFLERLPRDLTLVRAEDARQRGFAPVTIRVDARAAGLIPTMFPSGEVLVNLSGPPGGVVSIVVANVKDASADLRDVIPTSLSAGRALRSRSALRIVRTSRARTGQRCLHGSGLRTRGVVRMHGLAPGRDGARPGRCSSPVGLLIRGRASGGLASRSILHAHFSWKAPITSRDMFVNR